MKIKTELLSKEITNCIINNLENIDADKIADTTAICALSEIKNILKNPRLSDFEAIEEIVCVFERYNIDFGSRHDF